MFLQVQVTKFKETMQCWFSSLSKRKCFCDEDHSLSLMAQNVHGIHQADLRDGFHAIKPHDNIYQSLISLSAVLTAIVCMPWHLKLHLYVINWTVNTIWYSKLLNTWRDLLYNLTLFFRSVGKIWNPVHVYKDELKVQLDKTYVELTNCLMDRITYANL